MTDCFTLLGLPPRAALDAETLRAAYLEATRAAHPDHHPDGDSAQAAALNAALETLKSPVSRLKHLLEHHANLPWRAVPLEASLMQIFEQLGPLLQTSASFLQKKQAAQTTLAKALLAHEELRLREALETLGVQVDNAWQAQENRLPEWDAQIAAGNSDAWQELQKAQAHLAYLEKWRQQIRERLLELTL